MSKILKHDGGPCPVDPDTEVVAQFRNGQLTGWSPRDGIPSSPIRAGDYRWEQWPSGESDWDIVRYREARPIGEILKPILAEIVAKIDESSQ
jgi:hypothetical protein